MLMSMHKVDTLEMHCKQHLLHGHREIVELLLSKNADVNAQGGHFGNALQAASYQGHREIVELLLSKNADVNAQGGFYGNALQAASRQGHREIVELLRSRGAIEEIYCFQTSNPANVHNLTPIILIYYYKQYSYLFYHFRSSRKL